MRLLKWLGILLAVYVLIVVVFESTIGYFQPQNEGTLVLTTTSADGTQADRVLTQIHHDDRLYVAVNHWPRAWYRKVQDNPSVQVTLDGDRGPYMAVTVEGAEHEAVADARPLPFFARFLMGFPPRYFVRLDPVG